MKGLRLPVERTESVVLGRLAAGPRGRLTQRLFDLWSHYFVGPDITTFPNTRLFDDTTVVVALGATGDLAGFGYINQTKVEVRSREVLVLSGGAFNHLEYNSSAALHLALFWQVGRIRMAHPNLPVMGISLTSNPIMYDTALRMIAVAAPRPGIDVPPDVVDIARSVAHRRGMSVDPNDPWIVTSDAKPAQAERIRRSRRYAQRTPAMLAFERRVPEWESGKALLIWVPLDVSNIALSMARLLGARRGQA